MLTFSGKVGYFSQPFAQGNFPIEVVSYFTPLDSFWDLSIKIPHVHLYTRGNTHNKNVTLSHFTKMIKCWEKRLSKSNYSVTLKGL